MPKPKAVPRVKKAPVEKKDEYIVTVSTSGQDFVGKGNSIGEALKAVRISTFKNKAIIFVEHKGITRQVMMMPQMMRKLIMPMNQQFLEKRMEILLR